MAMKTPLDLEDLELDRLWRARFGQPLPLLGCAELVREVLARAPNALTEPRSWTEKTPTLLEQRRGLLSSERRVE